MKRYRELDHKIKEMSITDRVLTLGAMPKVLLLCEHLPIWCNADVSYNVFLLECHVLFYSRKIYPA